MFLKRFGLDVLHKERSAPLLFIIYMLKRVFCKDNLAKYIYGSINVKTFQWKHSPAIHRSFAVEFIKICRYKTFWMSIIAPRTFLLFRCCSIHVKMCVLVRYSARN